MLALHDGVGADRLRPRAGIDSESIMTLRTILAVSVFLLPSYAQQEGKPSPFPEKNREKQAAGAAAERSRVRGTRPARKAEPDARTQTSGADRAANPGRAFSKDTGTACYFSSRADGGLTASGERLNAGELVAGHASYPLGSRVKVTNTGNGKTVTVRIVDRFPSSQRIINVSEAAARELDFVKAGTAEVKLEPVVEAADSRERQ